VNGRTYRVVVAGELGARFTDAFEGMELTVAGGQTEIKGLIIDRARLRALLKRIDDLGLTLVSVSSEPDSDLTPLGRAATREQPR
jgi:phospholipase/lecithinase/hemolysin